MRKVLTYIAPSLYQAILKEKLRLQARENKKIKSRKNKITMIDASSSLARKLR
jgi:hypothetical protein